MVHLHNFCDASGESYSSAVYLRNGGKSGVEVLLIASKVRVYLRELKIPKLELLAVVLGVRLAKVTGEASELKINSRHFWYDNRTVLQWMQTVNKLSYFVDSRIGEILKSSNFKE